MKREIKLEVTGVDHDYGTVIVLEGIDDTGQKWLFGADRRPALDIIAAMEVGELPEVYVEDWQLIKVAGSWSTMAVLKSPAEPADK